MASIASRLLCALCLLVMANQAWSQTTPAGLDVDRAPGADQDLNAPLDLPLPFDLGHLRMSVGMDYVDPDDSSVLNGASLNGLTETDPGLDMNVALDAGLFGELAVGFRVRQAQTATIVDVLPDSDFDPTASLGLGWSKGQFSGQLDAHQKGFADGSDERALIDIDFAWRTPWQGTISLGARNIFDARDSDSLFTGQQNFDGLYGRMPYVRYQHDL